MLQGRAQYDDPERQMFQCTEMSSSEGIVLKHY